MAQGFILWLTGLSGAGKSTLARHLAPALRQRGLPVEVLDGDEVRTNLSKGLGFSREDRDTHIRRIGYVSRLLARNGVAVISAAISPYRTVRDELRDQSPNFIEVFVRCPLAELVRRDVKGLYEKALRGEIQNFTGVSDPYEGAARTGRRRRFVPADGERERGGDPGEVGRAQISPARGDGGMRSRAAHGCPAPLRAALRRVWDLLRTNELDALDGTILGKGAILQSKRGHYTSETSTRITRLARPTRRAPAPLPSAVYRPGRAYAAGPQPGRAGGWRRRTC